MTRAEWMAGCVATGTRRYDCEEVARDHSVSGVWCDGTIVLGSGGARCVPRSTMDRVAVARASSPLVRAELEDAAAPASYVAPALVVGSVALLVWLVVR